MNKLLLISIVCIFISASFSIAAPVPDPNYVNSYNVQIHNLNSLPESLIPSKTINNVVDNESKVIINKDNLSEIREQAIFLYNTNAIAESKSLFLEIPETQRNSDDYLYLANIEQDLNNIDSCVLYLKKSIELDENNYKAHYNLGNIYFEEKQYNAALKEYNKVLKIRKDFAYAHYNKGCCYLAKNSLVNARYEFGLAIKENPNEALFYYNLAYTNKLMKKDKKAQEALAIYNQMMAQ